MDNPDAEPTLEQPKTEHCFNLFDKLNCVRKARPPLRHEYGYDHDDESIEKKLGRLDEDKMMAHILDCVGAVCEAQRARVALKKPLKHSQDGETLTAEQQAARNKVFKAALALAAGGLTHDGLAAAGRYGGNAAVRKLMFAFPDDKDKATDGRGWLPLHWAVVGTAGEQHGVTEADVEVVYGLDPAALCRHHLDGSGYRDLYGFTPAHLLVMQETTERTRALLRYFSICRPLAFTMNVSYYNEEDSDAGDDYPSIQRDVFGALNVACRYGQPTEWLLQQLVQLDSSACRGCPARIEWTPLGALCRYNEHVDERLMRCLLAADSSTEVVVNGIYGCFNSASTRIMSRVAAVKLLLEANPAAARHKDSVGWTLAHSRCSLSEIPAEECIDILKLQMNLNKDAFRDFAHGELPIHLLASQGPVEALEYLLDACPETVARVTTDSELAPSSRNLMHCVVKPYSSRTPECTLVKVRLLCSRYPTMMLQRDSRGQTPLYLACSKYWNDKDDESALSATILALCEAGGREVVSAPVIVPVVAPADDDDGDADNNGGRPDILDEGWLPLHIFVSRLCFAAKEDSLLSPWADTFRLLLRLYPEAAGIEGGRDYRFTSPYGLAVERGFPAYYRRLLLRAAPDLDPAELRRLNWAERRLAMFLAFTAFGGKPPLLACLRYENVDLVKQVVSFL